MLIYLYKNINSVSLSNSKEKCPTSEANNHSASQGIARLLWNPKFHYHVRKSPQMIPILSQIHSIHAFPPYFSKIQSNTTYPSTPMSYAWTVSFTTTTTTTTSPLRSRWNIGPQQLSC